MVLNSESALTEAGILPPERARSTSHKRLPSPSLKKDQDTRGGAARSACRFPPAAGGERKVVMNSELGRVCS